MLGKNKLTVIYKNAKVTKIHKNENEILTGLTYEKDGEEVYVEGDYIISSMQKQ